MKSLIKKWAAVTAAVLTGAFLLTGCSSMKLAAGFDEQKLKESAQQAVQYLFLAKRVKAARIWA